MEAAFWLDRWESGATHWHRDAPNPALLEHWSALGVSSAACAFVPLCGASEDMAWLASRGHHVLGVDLSEQAAAQFFAAHGYPATRSQSGKFVRHASDVPRQQVTLLSGDFFDLDTKQLGPVDAVYDRAALVALPPPMRERYARHLLAHLPRGTPMLLLTYDYDQDEMPGPPFAVTPDDVQALYAGASQIERIDSADVLEQESGLAQRGLSALTQHAFVIEC